MRELHLTPENLLPAITPQDQVFAEMIVNQYDLPLDEISRLISVCLLTQIVNKYRGLPAYIKKVPGILESKIMNP